MKLEAWLTRRPILAAEFAFEAINREGHAQDRFYPLAVESFPLRLVGGAQQSGFHRSLLRFPRKNRDLFAGSVGDDDGEVRCVRRADEGASATLRTPISAGHRHPVIPCEGAH